MNCVIHDVPWQSCLKSNVPFAIQKLKHIVTGDLEEEELFLTLLTLSHINQCIKKKAFPIWAGNPWNPQEDNHKNNFIYYTVSKDESEFSEQHKGKL